MLWQFGVQVGNHCVILPNTVISHDSIIYDYCCIGSNVSILVPSALGRMLHRVRSQDTRKILGSENELLSVWVSNVLSTMEKETVAVGNPARADQKKLFLMYVWHLKSKKSSCLYCGHQILIGAQHYQSL